MLPFFFIISSRFSLIAGWCSRFQTWRLLFTKSRWGSTNLPHLFFHTTPYIFLVMRLLSFRSSLPALRKFFCAPLKGASVALIISSNAGMRLSRGLPWTHARPRARRTGVCGARTWWRSNRQSKYFFCSHLISHLILPTLRAREKEMEEPCYLGPIIELPRNSTVPQCVCVCVCACVGVRARVCVCVCVPRGIFPLTRQQVGVISSRSSCYYNDMELLLLTCAVPTVQGLVHVVPESIN